MANQCVDVGDANPDIAGIGVSLVTGLLALSYGLKCRLAIRFSRRLEFKHCLPLSFLYSHLDLDR
jgi:hypothetical protein